MSFSSPAEGRGSAPGGQRAGRSSLV